MQKKQYNRLPSNYEPVSFYNGWTEEREFILIMLKKY